ncbi:MAG: hypothetical protein VXZ48_03295, partial [Pseudomonadota bacterium]|nr:hypothetical protein [Pseudomonadota bacterium]
PHPYQGCALPLSYCGFICICKILINQTEYNSKYGKIKKKRQSKISYSFEGEFEETKSSSNQEKRKESK